ncbi:MAG: hypothetical protein LC102_10775 [Ignavibacteriales bacterium]|nr:MAG: hypothetical protein F9K26_05570 [Ignavibacteriaceae bacterium]MBW7873674.1 hypothetical protein [Ignavibacteria bacterium]MCZ2143899.1 hypothetical protein [Ignavibacteriales bacterium]WKZ71974.1 MAG: hypothetical protein QY308_10125 [Ignavibacteriaceae bacterium]
MKRVVDLGLRAMRDVAHDGACGQCGMWRMTGLAGNAGCGAEKSRRQRLEKRALYSVYLSLNFRNGKLF